jgi:hypothetical protein
MSSATLAPDGLDASRIDSSDTASQDPWAKALRRLPPEDQKQFSHSEPDMLGTLKEVSLDLLIIKRSS